MTSVKICGLTRESDIEAAVAAGADRVGLNVIPTSPRHIEFETARRLARLVRSLGAEPWVVGAWGEGGVSNLDILIRDCSDIAAVQLHGKETVEDVADFGARVGPRRRLIKALGIAQPEDLDAAARFNVEGFLFDAKPPKGADRQGGFGKPFDWGVLRGWTLERPWVLSGGLTPDNVAEAIRISGASAVDVSSGVEASPGVKDPAKVRAFIQAAKGAV
jgi:phosphoribosylanthranilate isomerase